MVAGTEVAGGHLDQVGPFDAAQLVGVGTAGVEPAAAGRVHGAGHLAGEQRPLFVPQRGVGLGHRLQQEAGVGMAGTAVQLLGGRHLAEAPQEHHDHPVGQVAHHVEIVGDEQVRQPPLLLQIAQQVQNLCLYGHVQRAHRLVADDEFGIQRQRPGDADALPLAAGKLVGVAVEQLLANAHLLHQRLDHLHALGAVLAHAMGVQRLQDDVPHLHAGVQGGVGILEDHLYAPPKLAELLPLIPGQVLAPEPHRAGGGRDQIDQQLAQGGLAAAGFPHQPQGLPLVDGEGHVRHGVHGTVFHREFLHQALGAQQLIHSVDPPAFRD